MYLLFICLKVFQFFTGVMHIDLIQNLFSNGIPNSIQNSIKMPNFHIP